MKKLSKENMGYFDTKIIFVFPNGDIILHHYENSSCIVKTSDFVRTYSKSEMKEIYNYPVNPK